MPHHSSHRWVPYLRANHLIAERPKPSSRSEICAETQLRRTDRSCIAQHIEGLVTAMRDFLPLAARVQFSPRLRSLTV